MLINICSLPRIADPLVLDGDGSQVATILHHLIRQLPLLGPVLVVQDEDAEPRVRLILPPELLLREADVLAQFPDRVVERRPRIVHFIDDQHVLPDQIAHLQTAEVEPLRSRDRRAGYFYFVVVAVWVLGVGRGCRPSRRGCTEFFVEREADRLDRDVG